MAGIWIPCPCCDEHFCTLHGIHACDCDCPPIDKMSFDPYSEGGARVVDGVANYYVDRREAPGITISDTTDGRLQNTNTNESEEMTNGMVSDSRSN